MPLIYCCVSSVYKNGHCLALTCVPLAHMPTRADGASDTIMQRAAPENIAAFLRMKNTLDEIETINTTSMEVAVATIGTTRCETFGGKQ